MDKKDAPPLELYIAAYLDPSSAEEAWNALKQSAHDKSIAVEALALVNRDDDGKVHVKDTTRDTGVGAAIGAVGGAAVGVVGGLAAGYVVSEIVEVVGEDSDADEEDEAEEEEEFDEE